MASIRVLSGLPPYGAPAMAFPAAWGRVGREGTVVEFDTDAGSWVGNFQPGNGGIDLVSPSPNERDVIVVAAGNLWVANPDARTAVRLMDSIDAVIEVHDPDGWVFGWQGLALFRFGPSGILWHTRRLSWDGLDDLRIVENEVHGLAWSPMDDQWQPFQVDLASGSSTGGSFGEDDLEGWERCAP